MKRFLVICMVMCVFLSAMAQTERFCIAREGKTASIILDADDWKGVIRAARDLGDDVRKISGVASQVDLQSPNSTGMLPHERNNLQASILVGTLGKSRVIDNLVKHKKIDVRQVKGQWESYLIDIVDGKLVVAGSDKRGTIYGIYEISKRIGVWRQPCRQSPDGERPTPDRLLQ